MFHHETMQALELRLELDPQIGRTVDLVPDVGAMEIKLAPDRIAGAEIYRNIVAGRVDEPAPDSVLGVIHLRAVELRRHDRAVSIGPERSPHQFTARPEIDLVVR